jgi:hypothetical protein
MGMVLAAGYWLLAVGSGLLDTGGLMLKRIEHGA